jgi:ribose/xylose/arabinose/galactoside ABC-type transport system permease subunit
MTQTSVRGASTPTHGRPASGHDPLRERLGRLLTGAVGTIAMTLAAVIVLGTILAGQEFLSASNIAIVGSFVAVPIIVGTFAGFSLLSGVVDLSIGSMVGFSAAAYASLTQAGWGGWSAAAVTLLLCLGFGVLNAVAIVTFNADPIAATLGMLTALRGLCRVLTGGSGAITAFNDQFYEFTNKSFGPLPLLFFISLVVAVLATVVVTKTRLGRHIRAVGGEERAAQRAGMSVSRIRYGALMLSAVGAGIGGILYIGQLGGASNTTGMGLEFQVYAALMIGGYSILRGGVGNPSGGVMGLLVVAGVSNLIDLTGVNTYFTNLIVGALLLAAVFLDRLRGGDAYE